jgi:hypothetical protein
MRSPPEKAPLAFASSLHSVPEAEVSRWDRISFALTVGQALRVSAPGSRGVCGCTILFATLLKLLDTSENRVRFPPFDRSPVNQNIR